MAINRVGLLIFLFLLYSCSTTKSLPEGEKLYTGARVKFEASGVSSKQKKVLRSDLQGLTRPRPNSKFLGIPFKLLIYNTFAKAKEKSFFGKFRDKFGQPPVLLSSVDLLQNTKLLQNHLENKGFFNAKVKGDTIVKKKKAHAVYAAEAGHQYKINSVRFDSSNNDLAKAIQASTKASLLKPGNPYDLDVIKGERNRIDAYLKEHGFYYFNPDLLIVKVDSTAGKHVVDMMVDVKEGTPEEAEQAYRINNVYIYSDYNLGTARLDTNKAHAQLHEGYYVIDRKNRFKPRLFAQALQFSPGEVYNRTDHNLTLSRLINLDEFRFVRNRFEQVEDTAALNAYYYLTPLPRKSIRGEVDATTKSNNLNGSQLSISWRNRNTFRAGEQFSVRAYVGSEIQFGGPWKGYNTYRSGAELNFAIPRFFVPFFDIRTRGGFIPRTHIQVGYDLLNRSKLYTLNSYRTNLGYVWKESLQKNHEFYPIAINYIRPLNITKAFRDTIETYPYLNTIIDSQFVIGSTYQYTLNQIASGIQKTNSFFFNGLVDVSGNLAGLLFGSGTPSNPKRIFNTVFNQYIKLEVDGRYYRKIGLKSSWVNRIDVGYGKPYGNSKQLPYIKQFFVGGNNSIRAFRSRTVGPGTYPLLSTSGSFPDQTGDIKIELNTEFRPHISGPLYGAVFVDAGNIWLANADPTRPGAEFSKNFLNELAIGTGAGIRIDIVLFVIRFDVGIPVKKPWEENPWTIQQIRLGKKLWRRDNIMYNLAIGYPF
ncbi:MAG TPA: BamA/TamA family outer membrane protein [Chitinophagaceae bacterium]|nr:BamA/TamA family outer membrane protein [Chitinophagaceae bacterium]